MSETSKQSGVLADRYIDIMLGDVRGTGLLLIQAPLIAIAVAGVWTNVSNDTPSLYFVLCLCAFFLGAVNSCREIVKERPLFLREKMFNLSVRAYLISKYRVQVILIFVQCVVLALVVRAAVNLNVNIVTVTLVLLAVAFTGTAVGLLISSWVKSADKAVAMVPLIVIPQILFSDFVLGADTLSNWTETAQQVMPVYWGCEFLAEIRNTSVEDDWGILFGGPVVLALIVAGCFWLSLFWLKRARY